jgi:hypothetical protein
MTDRKKRRHVVRRGAIVGAHSSPYALTGILSKASTEQLHHAPFLNTIPNTFSLPYDLPFPISTAITMLPNLPNELWQKIFKFVALSDDPLKPNSWLHNWLPCRQVSKGFRANTAQAYLEAFLRYPDRCVIIFDCGAMRGTSDRIEIDMFYQGIDPKDGGRIVFQEGEDSHELSGEKKHNIWRKKMERYLGAADRDENIFDLTPYIICIYGVALDSELPSLRFDIEDRRVSFEWEGMLNAFILERKEIDRRIVEAERKNMNRELRNRQKIPGFTTRRDAAIGLFGPLIGELQMMSINTKNRKRSFKKVRRHRILKFHRQKLGCEMTVDLMDRKHESKQVKRVDDADQAGFGGDESDVDEDEGSA